MLGRHRDISAHTIYDTKRIVPVAVHTSGHIADVSYDSVVEAGHRLDTYGNTAVVHRAFSLRH